MLQVRNSEGKTFLVMSETAYKSLTPEQISSIEKYSEIIYSDFSTIETNGGGSARCMLAEVLLAEEIKYDNPKAQESSKQSCCLRRKLASQHFLKIAV